MYVVSTAAPVLVRPPNTCGMWLRVIIMSEYNGIGIDGYGSHESVMNISHVAVWCTRGVH